jgi:hypothetical protein
MKHRAQNKLRARKRYRKMRNNSVFKRHQKLYRLHPERFHRRLAGFNLLWLPFWSATLGDGVVVAVDEDEVFVTLEKSDEPVVAFFFQDFLDAVTFLEEADIDKFFDALDGAMGVSLDAAAVSDALVGMLENQDASGRT